jgi:hypothetical protein
MQQRIGQLIKSITAVIGQQIQLIEQHAPLPLPNELLQSAKNAEIALLVTGIITNGVLIGCTTTTVIL